MVVLRIEQSIIIHTEQNLFLSYRSSGLISCPFLNHVTGLLCGFSTKVSNTVFLFSIACFVPRCSMNFTSAANTNIFITKEQDIHTEKQQLTRKILEQCYTWMSSKLVKCVLSELFLSMNEWIEALQGPLQ